MRRMKLVFCFFIAFIVLSVVVEAEDQTVLGDYLKNSKLELEISSTIDFYNKYVWRGFLLDKDRVVQPGITVSLNGFEGGFWGSWDLQGDDALSSDEVDGWIGYSFDCGFLGGEFDKLNFSLGHTWYDFPEVNLYTKEFYLSTSLDIFLSPYVTWYCDYVDEGKGGADGNYIMFGLAHSLDLISKYGMSLDLGMEYGYNDDAFIDGKGSYFLTTAGINIPLTEKVCVTPNIGYSVPFGDLDSGGGNDQDEQFYGGVSLAFSF